jgi:ribosomal protein S18 acetylase RimI-like enzyme
MKLERVPMANRKKTEKNIAELQDMCGYFSPLNSWLRTQLDTASDVVYAMDGENLYGYILLDKKKDHLEVELICVGKEGQKQKGIGWALMKKAEEIAHEYKLSEIQLDSQFAAEGFYKKLNFEEVSRNNHGVRMKKSMP